MDLYDGKRTDEFIPDLPAGTIRCGEKWVESKPITFHGSSEKCFITGKIDSLIEFDDGSWGILDFKTTETTPEKAELYSRQLHAYAYCFENPADSPQVLRSKPPALSPISKLGILCFEPSKLTIENVGHHTYQGEVTWIEISLNYETFLSFVNEIIKLLSSPMPEYTTDCNWCKYSQLIKDGNFGNVAPAKDYQDITCPECGSSMTERNGKFGKFLGCTKYPECKGTRKI